MDAVAEGEVAGGVAGEVQTVGIGKAVGVAVAADGETQTVSPAGTVTPPMSPGSRLRSNREVPPSSSTGKRRMASRAGPS